MTIIVATSWNGKSSIASDSYGTDGYGLQSDLGSKLREYEFGWVGFSGSYALLPFISDALDNCRSLETEEEAWAFSKSIRQTMMKEGWEDKGGERGLPNNGDLHLIIASNGGKLWSVQGDFAVIPKKFHAATGSGKFVAIGALAMMDPKDWQPKGAALEATGVAISLIATCGGKRHSHSFDHF